MSADERKPDEVIPESTPPTAPKQAWVEPAVTDLAPLTELTFQTPIGDPIGGGPSVFP